MSSSTVAPNPPQHEARMAVFAHAELSADDRYLVFKNLGDITLGAGSSESPGFSAEDFRYFESQLHPKRGPR